MHHDRLRMYFFEPGVKIDNEWVWSATKTRSKLPAKDASTQWSDEDVSPSELLLEDGMSSQADLLAPGASAESRKNTATDEILEVRRFWAALIDTARVVGPPFDDTEDIVNLRRPRGRPRKVPQRYAQ